MQSSGYHAELWCFLALLVAVLLLGFFSGATFIALSLFLALYCVRFFHQTRRLAQYVHQARRGAAVDSQLSGVWGDIAEDVRFVQLRHEREKQRLQAVVVRVQEMTTALTDGVILIDKRGNMEWWNQAAGNLFGFQAVDQGHKLTNLIRHPKFVHYFDSRDYCQPLELLSTRKQEQQLQIQVHGFGQGERLVVARDITRLFKLEQMRKDFVANVSHELRTPLTVLKGYLETLNDSDSMPPGWQKPFDQMAQQTQRMSLLIQDLLMLSKLETEEREPKRQHVKLAPLLQSILDDAQQLSGAHQHRFVILGDAQVTLLGCEAELRSALANLIYNAVNYSPDGSQITVSCQHKPTGFEIYIKDNGIGIDTKHLPRLTERFYRVDPGRSVKSGGTGLGLAIVKHILLRHDAELQINSMPGKGSTFYCLFPREALADSPPQANA
jgi:two-component system, OmpR family, phosphate regulon sensor histidine kinase PhoR